MGLGRPAAPVATLEKRPTASPCSPKPTASLGTRSTACGRQVLSLGNAWRRRGGQRALLLHPSALPNSRSGHRCDGGRLPVDLGRSVDLEAFRPLARRTRCRQRSRSRSARSHGLPRPGGLADGRVGRHGVASRVPRSYWCVKRLSPNKAVSSHDGRKVTEATKAASILRARQFPRYKLVSAMWPLPSKLETSTLLELESVDPRFSDRDHCTLRRELYRFAYERRS